MSSRIYSAEALCVLASLLLGSACEGPAALTVVSVQSLGTVQQPSSIQGRDGGCSGLFQNRSVWVFGDTGTTSEGTYSTTWRNNTMSWTSELDASQGIKALEQPLDSQGSPKEFFPRTAQEEAFNNLHLDKGDGHCVAPCGARYAIWGSGPIEDKARKRAILAYGQVYSEPGDFNFHIVGTSLAIWENFDAGPVRPAVDSTLSDPTLLFDGAKEGEFSIPALNGSYFYLFSCSGGPHGDSHDCLLARAPLEEILHRSSWEFHAAVGWSSDVKAAVPLFQGSPNLSVYWNSYLNQWLVIYMDFGKILMRTATALDGTWSEPQTVFVPSESGAGQAQGHAEFQERGGQIEYISYLADTFKLIRVELGRR